MAAQRQALERERHNVTTLQDTLRQLEGNLKLKKHETLTDRENHTQRQHRAIAQQLAPVKMSLLPKPSSSASRPPP